jgi:hypothetical protein
MRAEVVIRLCYRMASTIASLLHLLWVKGHRIQNPCGNIPKGRRRLTDRLNRHRRALPLAATIGCGVLSLIGAFVACASMAHAAPGGGGAASSKAGARAKCDAAKRLVDRGEYKEALVMLEEGLAAAPSDRCLLGTLAPVLMALHQLPRALDAYQAYLATGLTGAKRHQVEEIIKELRPLQTTFLTITVTNGPARIYVPVMGDSAVCTAAPSCSKLPVLPRVYPIIAERPGFERWTGRAAVKADQTTALAITLVEQPSPIAVRVSPAGARVTVDGAPFDPSAKIPSGRHRIAASLAGHRDERRDVDAHEGKPVEVDMTLLPVVPIRMVPANAGLVLDGHESLEIKDGGVVLPPGEHTLVARARGFDESIVKVPAERPAGYAIAVELAPHVVAIAPSAPGRFTPRRKLALVAAGASAAAIATTIVLWIQARQLERDAYASCPEPTMRCDGFATANDRNRSAQARALAGNIAVGIAGGAAIAAGVLWVTGKPEARVAVAPSVGAVSGLDLAVRF